MQDYFSTWTLESGFLEFVINLFTSAPAKRGFALTLRLWIERNFGPPYRDFAAGYAHVNDYPKRWPVCVSWHSLSRC
jgi:hypothetical protein